MVDENLEKGITKKYAIINNLVIFHDLHISSVRPVSEIKADIFIQPSKAKYNLLTILNIIKVVSLKFMYKIKKI